MESTIQNFIFKYIDNQTLLGIAILFIILSWSLIFKSLGLWKSARNNERIWFAAILIVNTLGILEIAYLFFFAKEKVTIDKLKTNIRSYKVQNPLISKK